MAAIDTMRSQLSEEMTRRGLTREEIGRQAGMAAYNVGLAFESVNPSAIAQIQRLAKAIGYDFRDETPSPSGE